MSLIDAKSVGVRRGGAAILDRVDLTLERGELVVVLGPNGAGKSTLARVLLGLERPSSGTVLRDPSLRVGYVPQALRRDPTLPVSTAAFLRLARRQSPHQTRELYEALDIDKLLHRPIAGLSGGELRRVALARALAQEPDILVLDEPLAGVDAASQEPIYELIAEHGRRTGAGIVLIAHEILNAVRLAQRILCLEVGPMALGTPAQVLITPAFAHLFGKAMAMAAANELAGSRCASPSPEPISSHG
jgi:zinc transport system ATP-binding protein